MEAKYITLIENTEDEKHQSITKIRMLQFKPPLLRNIFSFLTSKDILKSALPINLKLANFSLEFIQSIDIIKDLPSIVQKLKKFKNLKELKIYKEGYLLKIIEWFFTDPNTNKLEKLLFSPDIFSNKMDKLSKCEYLFNLKELILDGNKLGVNGALSLSEANFPNLEVLSLNSCEITSSGVDYLSKSKFAMILKKLNLNSNSLGSDGAHSIDTGNFHSLRILYLRKNNIGDSGVDSLANGNLRTLEVLWLEYNKITNEGVSVINSQVFSNLRELSLYYNDIREKDRAKEAIKAEFAFSNGNFKLYL